MTDTQTAVSIEISGAESDLLRQILETCLSDLRMEIAGTDSLDYRDRLKVREELLKRMLSQMGGR